MKHATLAPLTKGRQITGPERQQTAARLRDHYAQGASIRDLMAQTGRSDGWTHRLLRESGAVLRGRGGAHPARHTVPPPASGPHTDAHATNPAARTPVTRRAAPTSLLPPTTETGSDLMIDSRVPLAGRSLRFAPGMFSDMARTRDTVTCAREAHAAREAAATSANPLLCLARAAWWAAVTTGALAPGPPQTPVRGC